MARHRNATTTPRWPEYRRLTPAGRERVRNEVNPDIMERRPLMAKREVCPERGICLDGLPASSNVSATIAQYGWDHFCGTRSGYDPEIVRKFYAFMRQGVFDEFGEVLMGDTRVTITPDAIRSFYRLPPVAEEHIQTMLGGVSRIRGVGDREIRSSVIAGGIRRDGNDRWTSGDPIKKSELHHDLAFWMVFLKASVKPSRHNNEVDSAVARVLFCIHNGLPLDIPKIIHLEILDAASSADKGVLPFPSLITHFCKLAGIASRYPTDGGLDLTSRTYSLQVTYAKKRESQKMLQFEHVWNKVAIADEEEAQSADDDDSDYDPETPPHPPLQLVAHQDQSVHDILSRIERKLDSVITEIGEIRTRVERIEATIPGRSTGNAPPPKKRRQPSSSSRRAS